MERDLHFNASPKNTEQSGGTPRNMLVLSEPLKQLESKLELKVNGARFLPNTKGIVVLKDDHKKIYSNPQTARVPPREF